MKTIDKEKVIQGLEHCNQYGSLRGLDCTGFYAYTDESGNILRASEHKSNCPYQNCETGCVVTLIKDAITLLKEKEKHGYWEIKKIWSPHFPLLNGLIVLYVEEMEICLLLITIARIAALKWME